ncbi:MAG: conjugative transposon protein TraM [Segetibacter sp.]
MKPILRRRKFYLVLPLLTLPFVTLAFWALGGGKASDEVKQATGLNLNLPDANLEDDKNADKLSFYNQADKDSLKREEALRNDPNFRVQPDTALHVLQMIPQNSNINSGSIDVNERKIYSKINELNKQISEPYNSTEHSQNLSNNINKDFSGQVDKLQNMMKVMTEKNGSDPETVQLNGMMDKILDIQHPERVKEKIKEKSITNKQQVFPVESSVPDNNVTLMQSSQKSNHNSFYELNNANTNDSTDHAIEAVVHETQTIVTGSTVKLRLIIDIYINGILIPKGNFIYGTSSLENERLTISILSVRYQNNLMPVALQVYDMDGLIGIYIPGSVSRDVAKESAEKNLQGIDITTIDPSVAAQVTGAGITAAKNLLSKKAKLVKVTLKAGYKILLKDNNKN